MSLLDRSSVSTRQRYIKTVDSKALEAGNGIGLIGDDLPVIGREDSPPKVAGLGRGSDDDVLGSLAAVVHERLAVFTGEATDVVQ